MSSRRRTRTELLLAALDAHMRTASAQGVLFSQTVAARLGIAATDLECLDIIGLKGPMAAGQLAAATGLTTGAVTGIIDRLEAAGFAGRHRDPVDRRKVIIEPLPAVERRIVPLFSSLQQAMAADLAGYGDDQLAFLVEFFKRAQKIMIAETAKLKAMPGRARRNENRKRRERSSDK
jgi:DNA-binding MarR family transcriptional regulator